MQRTAINYFGEVSVGSRRRDSGTVLVEDYESTQHRVRLVCPPEGIVCQLRRRCVVRLNRGAHLRGFFGGFHGVHSTPFMRNDIGGTTTSVVSAMEATLPT